MTDDLRRALLFNRRALVGAVDAAERELEGCRQRCAEIEDLLDRARAVLELDARPGLPSPRPRTLHEAMETVLRGHPAGLTAREIAAEVNRRALYARRDRRPLDSVQVHARATAYSSLFTRDQGRIRLHGTGSPRGDGQAVTGAT
jgi:hypothetical protein